MSFLKACNFIKKETLAQVFLYEFCEISKNTFSNRTPLVAASRWRYESSELNFRFVVKLFGPEICFCSLWICIDWSTQINQKQLPEVFCKNHVLRIFVIFTGKHFHFLINAGQQLYLKRDFNTVVFVWI